MYIYQSSSYVYSEATDAAAPKENRSAAESAIPRNEMTKLFAMPSAAMSTAIVTTANRMLPVTMSTAVSSRNRKTNVSTSAILFSSKNLILNLLASM